MTRRRSKITRRGEKASSEGCSEQEESPKVFETSTETIDSGARLFTLFNTAPPLPAQRRKNA
jgi:hypothetical protein